MAHHTASGPMPMANRERCSEPGLAAGTFARKNPRSEIESHTCPHVLRHPQSLERSERSGPVWATRRLEIDLWQRTWDASHWREYLALGGTPAEIEAIRKGTHTGRPLGTPEFIESLEKTVGRRLVPPRGGRPEQPEVEDGQGTLTWTA
jgi:hypothetical protein